MNINYNIPQKRETKKNYYRCPNPEADAISHSNVKNPKKMKNRGLSSLTEQNTIEIIC